MKSSDLSEFFNLLGKAKKEKEEEFDNLLKEADINLDDLTSSIVSGIKEAKEDQKKQKKNEEKLIEQLDSIIDVIENPKEVKDITEPAVTVGVPEDFDVSKLEEEDNLDVQDWNDGKNVNFTEVDAVDIIKPEPIKTSEVSDTVAQAIKFIEDTNIKEEIENSDDTNLDKLKKEIKQVRDILYKVLAHGPGSGEVRVLKMDDVDEDSAKVDGKVLQYQSSSSKFVGATMPSNNNQLTNGAGYITTSFTNTNQLTNGAGFITASDNITGTSAGLTGTPNITVGSVIASTGTFSGNVSIAGTLTYEDVTNIDSVGLITARSGVLVGSGITLSPDGDIFAVGVSTFTDDINLPDNVELKLGNAGEVRLFHSGVDTKFIISQHFFNMHANGYNFLSQNGSETLFTAFQNGAVSLFFDNTKRFETSDSGAEITGDLEVTNTASGTALKLIDSSNKQFAAGGGGGGSPFAGSSTNHDFRIQVGANQNAIFEYNADEKGIFKLGPASGIGITFNGASGNANFAGITTFTGTVGFGTHITLQDDAEIRLGERVSGGNRVGDFIIRHDPNMFGSVYNVIQSNNGNIQIENRDAGGQTRFLYLKSDGVQLRSYTGNEAFIQCTRNQDVKLYYNNSVKLATSNSGVDITGDLTVSGSVSEGSDIRLKTNIKPIEDPIDKVTQIEGVSFNWKKDNKPSLGVIADQVEKIIPELVQGDDPKTVNYNGLIGLLIEAVKDQQTQIDSLKERLSKLE